HADEQIRQDLIKAYENFRPPEQQQQDLERHGSNEGGNHSGGDVTLMQVTPTAAELAMLAALAGLDQLAGETEPLGETDSAPLIITPADTGTPQNTPDQT